MEHISANKRLAIPVISTLLLSGCGVMYDRDAPTIKPHTLETGQPIYPSSEAANTLEHECGTLNQAIQITPTAVQDVGAWLILQIDKSDISVQLTNPNACAGDLVYATLK